MDRDLNSSLSLRDYGLAVLSSSTGSSPGSYPCGDSSGGGTAPAGAVYESWIGEAASNRSFALLQAGEINDCEL
jgi:hypothetical protein